MKFNQIQVFALLLGLSNQSTVKMALQQQVDLVEEKKWDILDPIKKVIEAVPTPPPAPI